MKIVKKMIAVLVFGLFCFYLPASAADRIDFSTTPKTNHGKMWRIAYYEGGKYDDYQKTLVATIKGLMELGWIETEALPPQNDSQTKELWDWLASRSKSNFIRFVNDGYYSAGWDKTARSQITEKVLARLTREKDIDLVIAMGTWAGKDLANNSHDTPVIVLSTSDPVSAGIIKSVEDSGYAHVHARVDPFRYERQIQIFHDIIGFKNLGLAYKNTVLGRSYAAVDIVEKASKELGFEITSCFFKEGLTLEEENKEVLRCFRELAEKVDAIYVTEQQGVNPKTIPEIVKITNSHQIPTFAQSGSEPVKYGLLMSISQAGFKYVGGYHAETIARVFNGAKPGQLDQIFEDPPAIAINLKTAEIIGFDPPVDVLGAADEIYQEITVPQEPGK
ncbi:MAG: ABC transporter substrate binding protein [Desulfobacterales bacterium]|nr:ABC transporter substrate binding protein [Desulfobacterales bacterium]MDD4072166.1 ABC transporter substrate binding protein [Desulfobacterales bacterium]MDD4393773.1 ABC transporter substrate binding protein [Desulfobacterales bacterium]